MNYTAVIFNNTGFNNSNIPDSDTFVYNNMVPVLTTTPLNVLQNVGLSNITIKAKYEDIKNVDYCYIYKTDQKDREHTFFYFITTVNMVNSDTVNLTLEPDFLTSAGGATTLEFLDGITERHHVSDDSFGKYTEDDVLLNCTEPLKLVVCKNMDQTNYDVKTFVDTTLDLEALGEKISDPLHNTADALTFVDTTTDATCTVPHVNVLGNDTLVVNSLTETLPDGTIQVDSAIGTKGFATFEVNSLTLNGMGIARDLGVEQAILNQYQIPNKYVDYSIKKATDSQGLNNNYDIRVAGKVLDEELPNVKNNDFIYNDSVKNKRCLYGNNNRYTLISSAGNKATYNPEQLIVGLSPELYPRPIITTKPDCRADGAPYFNFKFIEGSSLFIRNPVKGSPWRTIPLVFQQKSGNILDQTLFHYGSVQNKLTNTFDNTKLEWQRTDAFGGMITGNMGSIMSNTGVSFASSNAQFPTRINSTPGTSYSISGETALYNNAAPSGALGIITAPFTALTAERNYNGNSEYLNNMFQATEKSRLYQLYSSIYTIAPEIDFGYNNEYIRDFYGNSYMVYRWIPSDQDLKRQDLLLTMYGYRHTDAIKPEYFTNRKYFNYISANNITIKNLIPNWWKTGISAQLSGGVRIWHVLPDTKYYEDNPINEATT